MAYSKTHNYNYNSQKHYKSQDNNRKFFDMCYPLMFNPSMIDNYKKLHLKPNSNEVVERNVGTFLDDKYKYKHKHNENNALISKRSKNQQSHCNMSQTLFSYNFHIIEMLYKEVVDVASQCNNNVFDKYFEKEKHHTLFLEFQQYKVPLYSLLENNQTEIKALGLKHNVIMEKFLEFNEKQGKKGKTNSYDFDIDVFLSLLRCMKVNCIVLLHKAAFIINDDVNEKYVFIGYDYAKTKTMFKGRELEKYLNKGEIDNNNDTGGNNGKYKYPYFCIALGEFEFQNLEKYIADECFIIDTISKPIKAVSSYKITELQAIGQKLNIDIMITQDGKQKKKTKQQLYSDIISELRNVNISV